MTWEQYAKKISLESYTPEDAKLIKHAFELASEIHKNEKRMTGEPYIVHPIAVSANVAALKIGASSIAAALLHDAYEKDSSLTKKIKKELGQEISFLIKGLTKVDKVQYHGVERSAESARKMFMAMAQDIRVVIIKLFDRLHNIETLHALPEEKRKRIATETLDIYAPVADRLGMGGIKLKLEDAAFKYAYPEQYEWILEETREKLSERERYLKKIIPIIQKELTKEKIPVILIHFRAKHYYSLWKKLLRNNMDWYMIYDLIAIRIVVDSIENCYSTLGVIHKLWKPLPGRIKDYIALPKQNGYQSLHTTVFCIDKKITEFQIRTEKMHDEAEQGIAAHWAWEIAGKPRQTRHLPQEKFSWINQLQAWHKKFRNELIGEKFLESLKIDFFKDRVFILTPKGDIVDLPEGATPIDFAYHIHSDIGDSVTGAKVNHHIVPLSYALASGDMVEIITQKNKKPNLKTLDYAKTSLAKNHIKAFLRKKGIIKETTETHEKSSLKKVEFRIVVDDRVGMLKDISAIMSSFRINISNLTTKETHNRYALINLGFIPKNKEQADKIAIRLKKIKGVEEVSFGFK